MTEETLQCHNFRVSAVQKVHTHSALTLSPGMLSEYTPVRSLEVEISLQKVVQQWNW